MLQSIRQFFQERLAEPERRAPADREHALRLAAAALLFEVVRADSDVKNEERTVMGAAIQSVFSLSDREALDLMDLAEEESRSADSLYQFTSLVDDGFSAEEKKRLVELLWMVSFADTEKHAEEEHLVRKIAGLLHVPHPDFIDAKIRARSGGEKK
ncbi:MAG TPA: TerB family tellurite resistance protein [Vicinamibacteria bacterium]|nr:TerB family tellurite resistance protein [Vicinamibacteria bacterium]